MTDFPGLSLSGVDETQVRRMLMGQEVAKRRIDLATNHHRNVMGQSLNLNRFPYLQQVYADPAESIVLQTGVQTGKTEWVIVDAFAIIACGLRYQIVQPKDDIRAAFLRDRITGPINQSEYYSENAQIIGSNVNWGRGTLRITFSTVANEMIAFPADAVGVDEVDNCNLENLVLLPDRMLGSMFRFDRRTSTPTVVGHRGNQNINYHYEMSDRKIWLIPCLKCGTEQEITWGRNVVEELRDPGTGILTGYRLMDSDWSEDCGRDVRCFCIKCGDPISRLSMGRWLVRNPKSKSSGYMMGKLISPLVSVEECYKNYQEAQGNPSALQRFANSIEGRPYQGTGDKITEEILENCAIAPYSISGYNTSTERLPCTMGVDVGGKLDVRVSDHPAPGVRRARFIGKVEWRDLPEIVKLFRVMLVVIDEEPERTKALEFQEQMAKVGVQTILCINRELKTGDTSPDLDDFRKSDAPTKVTIDRTIWMDRVHATYVRRLNWLPRNWRELSNRHYGSEMMTPTRVSEVATDGRERFVWTPGQDHSYLADTYDLVASTIADLGGRLGAPMHGASLIHFTAESYGKRLTQPDTFAWN